MSVGVPIIVYGAGVFAVLVAIGVIVQRKRYALLRWLCGGDDAEIMLGVLKVIF